MINQREIMEKNNLRSQGSFKITSSGAILSKEFPEGSVFVHNLVKVM
jgi:hypothetical protein